MIPVLFKIGPITVGSYGVMLAIAFLTCLYLLRKEFQRAGYPVDWAYSILFAAAIGGIIGARLYFIIEHFGEFIRDPLQLIFSGDGGSVGMGHVYLNNGLLDAHRTGGIERAIDWFLARRNLPDRIFNNRAKKMIRNIRRQSLVQEMSELADIAPGRDFYLFLIRNDQRRHLHDYWEHIDLFGIEFLMPFYDSNLLELIASAPIDPFIGHHFYYEWLDLFPGNAKSVPWQAYPGHVPCPIPDDDEYMSQWENYQNIQPIRKKRSFHNFKQIFTSNSLPDHLIKRHYIYAAIAAHALKVRDVNYIFDIICRLHQDLSCCSSTELVI